MRFKARVESITGEWIDMELSAILLDKQGKPEAVIGKTGLQYTEFELEVEE